MATDTAEEAIHKTLTAGQIDTITITKKGANRLELLNRTTDKWIYFRLDGVDPEVEGKENKVVPPGSARVLNTLSVAKSSAIKLISSGAAAYSIMGYVE